MEEGDGGLDWRDLAGPTREVIDSKAERVELAALDIRAAEEAERLRNYAETIEAKADSGAAGVLQVREDLKLYATREETAQKITSEVLRVEGETDEKLKAYATLQQTAERISAAVTQIDKELTRYATLEQTAQGIQSVVADIAQIDGRLALKVDRTPTTPSASTARTKPPDPRPTCSGWTPRPSPTSSSASTASCGSRSRRTWADTPPGRSCAARWPGSTTPSTSWAWPPTAYATPGERHRADRHRHDPDRRRH